MKKIRTACTAVLLAAGAMASVGAASAEKSQEVSFVYPLDEAAAQELALLDAGVESGEAQSLRTKPEREDGEDVIEVDFYFENNEYEYTIRTEDGMILEWQIEGRDVADAVAEQSLTDNAEQTDAGTADNAKQTDAGAADNAEQTDAGTADSAAQTDAGTAGDAAAKFVTADGTGLVGLEKAKEAVQREAGNADGLVFTKIHFECGRRSCEYEFEAYADGWEYEYTVDAQTGEVLFWERDD